MAAPALDPKEANLRYHDAAAAGYDEKWAISFDPPAVRYVRQRAERLLPEPRYQRVLEVGAGTGFFLLNLWQAGFVGEAHAADISERMLAVCRGNAEALGCVVETRVGDAEHLPYEDESFDLVVGHAFLHHVPDPRAAIEEIHRVLRPGGALLVAGEPTRWGDRLAGVAKAGARAAIRTAARLPGLDGIRVRPGPAATDEERVLRDLEFGVDLHTFDPAEVVAWIKAAGFERVRVETEELTASLLGWAVRTIEGEARPGLLGRRWARAAYLGWRALYRVDGALHRVLPGRLFYNLLVYGERPPG